MDKEYLEEKIKQNKEIIDSLGETHCGWHLANEKPTKESGREYLVTFVWDYEKTCPERTKKVCTPNVWEMREQLLCFYDDGLGFYASRNDSEEFDAYFAENARIIAWKVAEPYQGDEFGWK